MRRLLSNETFTVEVPKTKNVSILKKIIKEEKSHRLKHADASDLILSQVSLPVDDDLEENLKQVDHIPLNPILPLSQVFPRVETKRLHIVVQAPPKGRLSTGRASEPRPVGCPGPALKGQGPGQRLEGLDPNHGAKGQLTLELALGVGPGRTWTDPI